MSTTIIDPVAQTFIVDSNNYPNGAYLSSICLFFRTKPTTNMNIQLSIMTTLNGYPTGSTLDNSIVTIPSSLVNVSETPHYKNSSTWTKFTFPCPVYINPDVLYAFSVSSSSDDFTLWTAAQNDNALLSTSKANYTDATPANPTKIATTPYVGDLFESQNALTWSADLTKDLMFVINRCKFDTTATPTPELTFVVPAGLPERKSVDISTATATSNVNYDALNISTTELTPPGTNVTYQYTTTLQTGSSDGPYNVTPGKYGTPLYNNISLNDNKKYRVLNYAANDSFILQATLNTTSDAVSPIVSEDGLTLYTSRFRINNMSVANDNIILTSGGTGYLSSANGTISYPDIYVSDPDDPTGTVCEVAANVVSGVIDSVYVVDAGSGYLTTPTITIGAANSTAAVVSINGETDANGGNGYARYITQPITLAEGSDSGDLRVFFSAYRPTNTDINVYYKIVAREDTSTNIDDVNWNLMTVISGQSKYSTSKADIIEYEAAPGTLNAADNQVQYTSKNGQTYTSFYRYMIKIVMSSKDSTYAPLLKDMRTIALPSGTGL
jgi:hypothetical protein